MPFYGVNFQYLPKGSTRPIDQGDVVDIAGDPVSVSALPQVGDFVELQTMGGDPPIAFSGRVRSRLFRYLGDGRSVNIVVEEVGDEVDWGKLIKE